MSKRLRTGLVAMLLDPGSITHAVADPSTDAVAQTVVITGSHIKRVDLEGALPVQVIRREEIERSGVSTVEQLLSRVPANVNAFTEAMSVGEVTRPGLSSANLRGLGGGSTLVLLNGRRLANHAFDGEAVDLSSIPLAAIDRIELLTDGASAIYGSDAIGGVINIILRSNFSGTQWSASGTLTEQGRGNQGQLGFDAGFGDPARDGYNLFGSIAYQRQQSLPASERDFARTGYRPELGLEALHGSTFPANIVDRPGRRILNEFEAAGCAPPGSLPFRPFPFRTPACGSDLAVSTDLLPSAERASALVRGTWLLEPTIELFAEALLARNRIAMQTVAMPVLPIGSALGPPLYPAGGPYYPSDFAAANGLSGDLVVAYRAAELGPRWNTASGVAQRYATGVKGRRFDWDFDVAAVLSDNRQDHTYGGGWLYIDRFIPALRTGLINPWGASAPEGQALLASVAFSGTPQRAHASTTSITASASRPIAALPHGALMLAIGAEARRERLSYDWDPEVLRNGFSPVDNVPQSKSGRRNVQAAHVELAVPLAPGFDAQLALRHDRYSDFGSTTNPKAALRWQPLRELLLRGSWGTGFRAPPLYALDAPPGVTRIVGGLPDPVRCPVTDTVEDCFIVVPAYAGGNPDLQPETSSQHSVGALWQATPSLSLGVDHWRIRLEGVIATLEAENALKYHEKFSDRILRGPVDPAHPDLPGPIVGLNLSPINLGTTLTSGFDAFGHWTAPEQPWGRLRVDLQATYVAQYRTQIDGVQFVSTVGDAAWAQPIPRWRSQLTFDWTRDVWGATLSQLYSSGYSDQFPGPNGSARRVGSTLTWDFQARWSGLPGWDWAAGIRNLFDRDPPASNQGRSTQVGYNPRLSNPLGRAYYLRGVWRFE